MVAFYPEESGHDSEPEEYDYLLSQGQVMFQVPSGFCVQLQCGWQSGLESRLTNFLPTILSCLLMKSECTT
jgi:hypothetical protein